MSNPSSNPASDTPRTQAARAFEPAGGTACAAGLERASRPEAGASRADASEPAGSCGADVAGGTGFSAAPRTAAPAVELRDVHFAYTGRTALRPVLDCVSLSFETGKVSAVIGPNGCGKSTTVKLISRALAPQGGKVLVNGDDVAALSRKELARRVAVLAQGGQVPSMQVEQFVMSGRYPHQAFFSGPSDEDRRIVREAMERAGCDRFAGANMERLSGGERQRVNLAMVLAQQAKIVVMDEPTTYLDVSACFDLMALVRELNDGGITVIMVLHDLGLALSSCDYLAVMAGGSVQAAGTPSEVVASGTIERTFDVRLRRVDDEGDSYYCLLPRR